MIRDEADSDYLSTSLLPCSGYADTPKETGGVKRKQALGEHDEEKGGDGQENQTQMGYWSLIKSNANFRLFFLSYVVTLAGEWFTYVASISTIGKIHASRQNASQHAIEISLLVALRIIPRFLFPNIGGVLADYYDRRKILIALSVLGSFVAWLFVLSHRLGSIACLYSATFLQMTISSMYEPTINAIIPMMITRNEGLQKSVTMIETTWGVMLSMGSALGGFAVGWVGIDWCFAIDSLTYLISGMLLFAMKGDFVAVSTTDCESTDAKKGTPLESAIEDEDTQGCSSDLTTEEDIKEDESKSAEEKRSFIPWLKQITNMAKDGLRYIWSQPWRSFIFIKVVSAFIWGAGDIVSISLAQQEGLEGSSKRLGIIFASEGAGSLIGPLIANSLVHVDDATSLEVTCIFSFLCMGIAWLGLVWHIDFALVCMFSAVRAAGSSISWVYSTLLLQIPCDGDMLGRVMGIEFTLANLGEASSAVLAGVLQDYAGLSVQQVSLVFCATGFASIVIWIIRFYFYTEKNLHNA